MGVAPEKQPVSEAPSASGDQDGNPRERPTPTTGPSETLPPGSAPLKDITGGVLKPAGSSVRLLEEATQKGLSDIGFDELPEYAGLNLKDQAEKAANYVKTSPDESIDAVLSGKGIPGDVHPQALLTAVKKYAEDTEDSDLIRQIARSPLNKQASLSGQTLAMSKGRYDLDPANIISDINKARREASGGLRADAAERSEMNTAEGYRQKSVEELKTDENYWSSVLKSIECDY